MYMHRMVLYCRSTGGKVGIKKCVYHRVMSVKSESVKVKKGLEEGVRQHVLSTKALTNQGGSGLGGRGCRRQLVACWNSLSLVPPSTVPKTKALRMWVPKVQWQ